MQDWSLHGEKTGGYYKCNRFETEEQRSGRFDPESNTAQGETRRMKMRAVEVERFIHHYTRFQAQGNSLLLERNMHKETIGRIVGGLALSAMNNLRWLQGEQVENPLITSSEDEIRELALRYGDLHRTPRASPQLIGTSSLLSGFLPLAFRNRRSRSREGESGAAAEVRAAVTASSVSVEKNLSAEGDQFDACRLSCMQFLNDGFLELFRCRQVRSLARLLFSLSPPPSL